MVSEVCNAFAACQLPPRLCISVASLRLFSLAASVSCSHRRCLLFLFDIPGPWFCTDSHQLYCLSFPLSSLCRVSSLSDRGLFLSFYTGPHIPFAGLYTHHHCCYYLNSLYCCYYCCSCCCDWYSLVSADILVVSADILAVWDTSFPFLAHFGCSCLPDLTSA